MKALSNLCQQPQTEEAWHVISYLIHIETVFCNISVISSRGARDPNRVFCTWAELRSAWWHFQTSGSQWWALRAPETDPSTPERTRFLGYKYTTSVLWAFIFSLNFGSKKKGPGWILSVCRFTSLTVFWLRAKMMSADAPRTSARFIFIREVACLVSCPSLYQNEQNSLHKYNKFSFLLYWPLHRQRTPDCRLWLCCHPSRQAPPRSTAPALWCRPDFSLLSPVSPHPEPEEGSGWKFLDLSHHYSSKCTTWFWEIHSNQGRKIFIDWCFIPKQIK